MLDVAKLVRGVRGNKRALGAQRRQIVSLIVLRGVAFAAGGAVIGVTLSLAASRWVAPLLFHESARDPIVIAVVALAVLHVAMAATSIPAARAAGADPNSALRAE